MIYINSKDLDKHPSRGGVKTREEEDLERD